MIGQVDRKFIACRLCSTDQVWKIYFFKCTFLVFAPFPILLFVVVRCLFVNDFYQTLLFLSPAKNSEPSMLVLIDQHAAHERVRLERLTNELFLINDPAALKSGSAVNTTKVK